MVADIEDYPAGMVKCLLLQKIIAAWGQLNESAKRLVCDLICILART